MGLLMFVFDYVLAIENKICSPVRASPVELGFWRQLGPIERTLSEKPEGFRAMTVAVLAILAELTEQMYTT